MKLLATYKKLKKKSVELLSKGKLDEYFEILFQISQLEKRMKLLPVLN